ncbi:unnamed protein product [Boreogadus saida]
MCRCQVEGGTWKAEEMICHAGFPEAQLSGGEGIRDLQHPGNRDSEVERDGLEGNGGMESETGEKKDIRRASEAVGESRSKHRLPLRACTCYMIIYT